MAALGGRSASDVRNELLAALEAKQPAPGSWRDGTQTTVTASLGLPTEVCDNGTAMSYRMPLTIQTADGRVDIAGNAYGSTGTSPDGALTGAWLEIYDDEVLQAQEFAERSGISGVDFGGLPRALWHTELYPFGPSEGAPRGEVVVEGITSAGAFVADPLDKLTWSLE
jgi:hypothetical protein